MRYKNIREARFLARPNRFIAQVELDGKVETVHVKNTGRCRELLVPGSTVYLQPANSPKRKTAFDLIAVQRGDRLINMDSQIPNRVLEEWFPLCDLFPGLTLIRPETRYGSSRFDFYLEAGGRKIYVEVKGVTLEEEGVVRFPDAPTLRGIKHLNELCLAVQEGYEAWVVFVIQMQGALYLEPNDRTQPEFGQALRQARQCGVRLLALDCIVTPDSITAREPVEIRL